MDTFAQDLRFGLRILLRNPGSSLIATLALVLGIGLTTLMFSIVYGAILRGLPFPDQHELLHVEARNLAADIESLEIDPHDYVVYREQQTAFESLAAFWMGTVNVSDGERPERFSGAYISHDAFPMLRVRPLAGRLFQPEDDRPGAPSVMLISHAVWRDRFEMDPGVIGRVVRANGRPSTVVGVMPEKFAFPFAQDVWLPLQLDANAAPRGEGRTLEVMGRLKPGRSIDDAALDLTRIAEQLASAYPETNRGVDALVKPYTEEFIGDEETGLLYTMLGAVLMVLLIACANVANLLIARAARRTREVGIRSAMGASRIRIVRQFLTESLALSLAGSLGGLAVAWIGIRLFNAAIVGTDPPFWIDIRLDAGVLLFVLAIMLLAAFASGAIPAWQAARSNVSDILKDEARGSSSFRLGRASRALVVVEIALSAGLLVGAGLMIKSVTQLKNVEFGFATEDVFTARLGLAEETYPDTVSRARFLEQLLPRIQSLPGVRDAAFTTALPATGGGRWRYELEGVTYEDERALPSAALALTTPSYFRALGVEPLRGRAFTEQDRAGSVPVAVVTASFERAALGGDAIGKRVRLRDLGDTETYRTVVGVVPDMFMNGLDEADQHGIYAPLAQSTARFVSVVARTAGDPLSLTAAVRQAVTATDADMPIYFVYTLQGAIDRNSWFYGVFGALFMAFGVAALFLAGVGLYGVMSTSVSHRTREMGVRMALGARGDQVLRLVLRQGMTQLLLGLFLGLALALAVANLLTMLLFRVEPRDPVVFGVMALVLSTAAAMATFIPAQRATRVDPVHALRHE